MVVATFGALLQVEGSRPTTPEDAFLGIFMEALAMEIGTEVAPMNVAPAAALFGHGCDASVVLQVDGGFKALALRTHSCQQARSQHRAGTGEAGEDLVVLM